MSKQNSNLGAEKTENNIHVKQQKLEGEPSNLAFGAITHLNWGRKLCNRAIDRIDR